MRSERGLTAALSLPPQAYQRGEAIKEFYRLLLDRVQTLPGVVVVAASSDLPLAGRERRAWTTGDPVAIVEPFRREVRRADPALAVASIETMEQRLAAALAPRRLSLALMVVFAAGALLMAAIGIYGILAYSVAQRTREIGVRLALGASRRDVLALVTGQGWRLTLLGLAFGAAAAFALTRFMAAMLYRTSPRDPWTFAAVAAVLAAIAAVACYLPARRAAGIEPVRALRTE